MAMLPRYSHGECAIASEVTRFISCSLMQCDITHLTRARQTVTPDITISREMPEITKEVKLDPSVIPPLDPSILTLSDKERAFLHATISEDDDALKAKILSVQAKAYAEHPYPCIRAFHFVNLMMSQNPVYPKVLEDGKRNDTIFIDLGCCMGSDVRKLVFDGYPAEHVLGCDLRQEFIDTGYELYKDKGNSPIHFFTSDIFDIPVELADTPPLIEISKVTEIGQLRGAISHFYTGALFHLFDEPTQYQLARRVASLLKLQPGSVIFGRHQGLPEERYIDDHMGRIRYGHSPASWPKLWEKVFAELVSADFAENRVKVEASLTEGFNTQVFQARHQTNMLVWSVSIV